MHWYLHHIKTGIILWKFRTNSLVSSTSKKQKSTLKFWGDNPLKKQKYSMGSKSNPRRKKTSRMDLTKKNLYWTHRSQQIVALSQVSSKFSSELWLKHQAMRCRKYHHIFCSSHKKNHLYPWDRNSFQGILPRNSTRKNSSFRCRPTQLLGSPPRNHCTRTKLLLAVFFDEKHGRIPYKTENCYLTIWGKRIYVAQHKPFDGINTVLSIYWI